MKKLNLIFLSTLLLTLVFGTTSYAKTLVTDTPKFVMTELLEYARDVQDELRSNYDLELREALINEMISNTNIDTLWHEFLNYYIGEEPNYLDQLVCMINLDYLDSELNLIFIPVKENATDSENYTLNLNETQTNTGFTTQVRTVDSSLSNINTRAFKLTIKNTGAISTGTNGTSSLSINNLNQLIVEENSDILNFPGIIGFNKEPYARVKLIQNASYTYYDLEDYIQVQSSGGGGEEDNPPSSGDNANGDSIDIIGGVTQGNADYWGNPDKMKGEDYENEISDGINDSMDKISAELEENEIFNSIAIAEQKIIDLFLENPEDFKISWRDVKYYNKTLVPAGEINFSQMCRDNETLGRVKNILNIIVSAMISLSLFKYIFNLIMVTLGIDHPLVLETEKDDITEISSTKVGNKTYVTKRTYKSDKKGGR